MKLVIVEHKGFPQRFKATLIPGLHKVDQPGEDPVTVISTEAGDVIAVPSRYVFTPEGLRYAEDWATQTHKSIFDIRVPDALSVEGS